MVGSRCDTVLCGNIYLNHRSHSCLEAAAKTLSSPPVSLYLLSTLHGMKICEVALVSLFLALILAWHPISFLMGEQNLVTLKSRCLGIQFESQPYGPWI